MGIDLWGFVLRTLGQLSGYISYAHLTPRGIGMWSCTIGLSDSLIWLAPWSFSWAFLFSSSTIMMHLLSVISARCKGGKGQNSSWKKEVEGRNCIGSRKQTETFSHFCSSHLQCYPDKGTSKNLSHIIWIKRCSPGQHLSGLYILMCSFQKFVILWS